MRSENLNRTRELLLTEEEWLFKEADRICRKVYGDGVFIRAIIEFSNFCRKNCMYCGVRRGNSKLKRYRMSLNKIVEKADCAYKAGFRTVVLQSGEDPTCDTMLANAIEKIKSMHPDMAITLSVGERNREVYKMWRKAGADRYFMRIETSDPQVFKRVHPDDDLEFRKKCLYILKELGYEVGTGTLIGLPGQTVESLAKDLEFFVDLDADMVGVGPFVPHPDTPLGRFPPGDMNLVLRMVAASRILIPTSNIPATTAMDALMPGGRAKALMCGANVIMPSFTPADFLKEYSLYPGKETVTVESESMEKIQQTVSKAGKRILIDPGFRKSFLGHFNPP